MKNLFVLVMMILLCHRFVHAQRLEYKGAFTPPEYWIKNEEKPYRDEICLNGSWEFQPIALPEKFKEGIDATPSLPAATDNGWSKTPIRIPSPWNVNSFADKNGQGGDFRTYPSYPKEWETVKMGWLRKRTKIPSSWKGKRIQIHFEAIAGDAEIFVNGKRAGHHFDIFLPFDVDVTDMVVPGQENEITVGVRKPSLYDKRGEYGRRNYQAGSFWGQHIAGIWQDVFLIALPVAHVSDVYINPAVDSNKLRAEITVTNDGANEIEVTVNAKAFPWKTASPKEKLKMPSATVKVAAHSTAKVSLAAAVNKQLDHWTPEHPNLYQLVVELAQSSKIVDSKSTRFGWRQISLQGSKVLLNKKEITMRGDSWHFLGIPQMTRKYAVAWYTAMRDAGLNAVRLHAQPYPSFYLDVADEMGILVLDETAMWASDGGPKLDDTAYWRDSKRHLSDLILRDRNHPSVFGWSVSNEIMPIVRGVMRNPPGMKETLVAYYKEWAATCRQLDPSRAWISADGEDDGEGSFPIYVVHYGGFDAMKRGENSGKPWGVGEAGNAYYGTPAQVAETNGDRAYESFLGRMEGVAASSYQSLIAQQQRNAVYQSVFNMVWYGLKPLALGMKDTTKAPTLDDGVYFTSFKEGQPGVQPERIGPYSTTLNPGYDPSLPLYQPWPLFTAIRDASRKEGKEKWAVTKSIAPQTAPTPALKSIKIISGNGGKLASQLKRIGVLVDQNDTGQIPGLLFVDGETPPDSRELIDKTLSRGGTVLIWGASNATLPQLNRLLPAPLSLLPRSSSSLLVAGHNDITTGITADDLYFSELRPSEIIGNELSGPLLQQSNIVLKANPTDWLRWNKQPEYAKTAMIVRSEREGQSPGAVLIEQTQHSGRLLLTTLPAAPRLVKAEKMLRKILTNLGVPLGVGSDAGKPLLKGGDIVRVLYAGSFPVASLADGIAAKNIDPASADAVFKKGALVQGEPWQLAFEESGLFDVSKFKMKGPKTNAVAYLSFWVSSPRDLSDLLIEPNIPVVNLEVTADDAAQVWLNGSAIINTANGGSSKATALKIRQGWNHFLVKVVQTAGGWQFSGRLTSNQPNFIADLESALEKP